MANVTPQQPAVLWNIPANTQVARKSLQDATAIVDNYLAVAVDHVACARTIESTPYLDEAYGLLKYWLCSIRWLLTDAASVLITGYPAGTAIDNTRLVTLNTLNTVFQPAVLQCRPPGAGPDEIEANTVPAQVPNRDILELLILARYHSFPLVPAPPLLLRPTNLGEFSTLLTNLVATAALWGPARAATPARWNAGFPAMITVCMSHLPQLLVGTTGLQSQFGGPRAMARGWRQDRFGRDLQGNQLLALANNFQDIQAVGTAAKTAFETSRAQDPSAAQLLGTRYNGNVWNNATDAEFNDAITQIHTLLDATVVPPNPFAYDHSNEQARSFRGSGPTLFQQTSRCWKCRFVAYYNVNGAGPALVNENPRTYSYNANDGGQCAEDLLHHFCTLAGGGVNNIGAAFRSPNPPAMSLVV